MKNTLHMHVYELMQCNFKMSLKCHRDLWEAKHDFGGVHFHHTHCSVYIVHVMWVLCTYKWYNNFLQGGRNKFTISVFE